MKKKHSYLSILWLIFGILNLNAQQAPIINARIKGKVIDNQTNEILIGASISIKGTTNGAVTDENGEFVLITGQKLPLTLMVSYVGYKNAEIVISDSTVEIKLEESENELQEITVSSRRRKESPQEIPLPISVISGANVENTGAFNPNRIKEYILSL
jgi:iron complex outermembrane receptor protein